jgi:hypothetical protein
VEVLDTGYAPPMKRVDLVVVISLGAECEIRAALDAVESVEAYTTSSRTIVVADHSGVGSGRRVQEAHRDVHVREMGDDADDRSVDVSYVHLARVFADVLRGHQFDALLRMGDEALITAPHPEADAIACFDRDQLVGATGRYRSGSGSSARRIRQQMFPPRALLDDTRGTVGRWRVQAQARRHGYRAGERVEGDACFYSYTALKALAANGYLPKMSLARTGLREDEIFGLTLRASGYHFCDLWDPDEPVAILVPPVVTDSSMG